MEITTQHSFFIFVDLAIKEIEIQMARQSDKNLIYVGV
jgi:hypothetical protein